jgi:hypothetical protein
MNLCQTSIFTQDLLEEFEGNYCFLLLVQGFNKLAAGWFVEGLKELSNHSLFIIVRIDGGILLEVRHQTHRYVLTVHLPTWVEINSCYFWTLFILLFD